MTLPLLTALFATAATCLPTELAPRQQAQAPTVSVKNGTLTGVHNSQYDQDFFLGVPFAQPPLDDLRFRNPQSLNTFFDGALETTEYAPECVGYGGDQIGYPISEDCLYLNVIRPAGYENASLPVATWIHGGGFYMGGTRDPRYNLSFIVENSVEIGKPVVGVSIAYRLSAWGFLQSEEVTGAGQTNIGLKDQRLALHWLQENIGAFGGDPRQVTIWGESAGASSVGHHLTAFNGRDDRLFARAIMESGGPIPYASYQSNAFYQPLYDQLVNATGCLNATDNLSCLRHVPYEQLNAAINSTLPGSETDTLGNSFRDPVVDGDFVARWGSTQLADGAFVHVPIIIGANSDEGTGFTPGTRNYTTDADFLAATRELQTQLPPQFDADILAAYPDDPAYYIPSVDSVGPEPYNLTLGGPQFRRVAAFIGDNFFIANRRGVCETWAAAGLDAFCYRFDTLANGASWYSGVGHFMEVAWVFDNTASLGYGGPRGPPPFEGVPEAYLQLAELMSKSWASFVADGEVNGWEGRFEGAQDWPVYEMEARREIVWDGNATGVLAYQEVDDYREEGIRFILDYAEAYSR